MTSRYSVVIPAFNAADTIADAIRSVVAQTVPPVSIVVIDDGSRDDTAAVAGDASACVRVIRQDNRGAGLATTAGIDAVNEPVLAMIDADDLWAPEKMERQLHHLSGNRECDGTFTHIREFLNHPSDQTGASYPGMLRSTMVIRTEAARRIGPMIDPPGGRGEMIDWLARAREAGLKFETLDEILAFRRVREGSLSHGRNTAKDRGYAHVAWLALQRRREKRE